jgi:uncharacterized protein (DUF1778 family)
MRKSAKTAQMQIRVSAAEKTAIHRAAVRAGIDMSAYVLSRVLSMPATEFRDHEQKTLNALAELLPKSAAI